MLSWPCSQTAVSQQPALWFHPPSARMHVQPWFSLHHLDRAEAAWVVAAVVAQQTLPLAAPSPLLALCLWKHICFALLPVQMLDKETDTLILSLAQSWRANFWNFPPENLHCWSLSVLSPA